MKTLVSLMSRRRAVITAPWRRTRIRTTMMTTATCPISSSLCLSANHHRQIASFSSSLKAPNNNNNPSLASITNTMPGSNNDSSSDALYIRHLVLPPNIEQEYSLEQKEEWLFGLLSQHEPPSRVHRNAFLVVLRALATSKRPDAALRAERWIQRLEKQHETILLQHHFQQEQNNAKENETDRDSSSKSKSVFAHLGPNAECYQAVIQAWSNSNKEDPTIAVTRAERWLLKHHHGNDNENSVVVDKELLVLAPTTETFNAFLDVCTKGRGYKLHHQHGGDLVRKFAQKAQDTLQYMIDHSRKQQQQQQDQDQEHYSSYRIIAPNIDSFNYVIRGWTRCRNSIDVVDRVMHVFNLLEEYQKETVNNNNAKSVVVCPNSKSYAMILDAISARAKLKVQLYQQNQDQLRRRERRRYHRQYDDDDHCNNDNDNDGDNLDDPSINGLKEAEMIQSLLETGYRHDSGKDGDENGFLTTFSYNMLISCWSHLSKIHAHGPLEAEKVLQVMTRHAEQQQQQQQGYSYRHYSGGGHHHFAAVAPDAVSYINVMRAWANSQHARRGQRVQWLLQKQWKDYEFARFHGSNSSSSEQQQYANQLRPTTESYNAVIRTLASVFEPQKAEETLQELLRHWKDDSSDNDDLSSSSSNDASPKLAPNSESFAYVIRAWVTVAKKGSQPALEKAVGWLNTLIEYEHQTQESPSNPTTSTNTNLVTSFDMYTSILEASRECAQAHPDVLDVAVDIFDKLRQSHHPVRCVDYTRLLQVGLRALSRPENDLVRTAFCQELIADSAESGLVCTTLLKALANEPVYREGWTAEESERLTRLLILDYWPLPYSWTRNVKEKELIPKRSDCIRTNYSIIPIYDATKTKKVVTEQQ